MASACSFIFISSYFRLLLLLQRMCMNINIYQQVDDGIVFPQPTNTIYIITLYIYVSFAVHRDAIKV